MMNVLVVDDQSGVRYLLSLIIQEQGCTVFSAQNGLEAVEMVCSVHPDLVFMDVRMPVMNGLEALRKIKRIAPSVQVVIMTAYSAEETVETALQSGALACIAKPFDVEEIKSLIRDFYRQFSSSGPVCVKEACYI